jgi:hypothetical protein
MRVFRPPGLAPGFVALVDETSRAAPPYYFCAASQHAQWGIPRHGAEKQDVVSAAGTAGSRADREKLIRLLKGQVTLEIEEEEAEAAGEPEDAEDAEAEENEKIVKLGNRRFPRQHEHPLAVARRKLDNKVISKDEYDHIRFTHAMLEGEGRSVVIDGILHKRGRRTGIWVQRWFQITTDLELSCSKTEAGVESPSSVFDLASVLAMPEIIDGRHAIRILDLHDDDELIVAAASLEDQILWVEAMLKVKKENGGGGHLNIIKTSAALAQLKNESREKIEEEERERIVKHLR